MLLARRRLLAALPAVGSTLGFAGGGAVASAARAAHGATALRVGRGGAFATLREALSLAGPGDIIEIEAGSYTGDTAVIDKDGVRVTAVGGVARLDAAGAHAEAKGILVVRARDVVIENLALIGARVPDHYGCGVRLERGSLLLRGCRFIDNELGVMSANDPSIRLEIEGCEFSGLRSNEGRGRALSHSLYAGAIDFLRVENCYFHDGSVGHLVKSRARRNLVRYNRLTDEGGIASYELEFPDGGVADVVGNVIEQGARSENAVIVSYAAESLRWADNRLRLAFNTLVNDKPGGGGVFVAVNENAQVLVRHNVLVGDGDFRIKGSAPETRGNVMAASRDFADAARLDMRPRAGASWVVARAAPGADFPSELVPQKEYRHPAWARRLARRVANQRLIPGAMQETIE